MSVPRGRARRLPVSEALNLVSGKCHFGQILFVEAITKSYLASEEGIYTLPLDRKSDNVIM